MADDRIKGSTGETVLSRRSAPNPTAVHEAVLRLRQQGWRVYRHGELHRLRRPADGRGSEFMLTSEQLLKLIRTEERRRAHDRKVRLIPDRPARANRAPRVR